MPCNACYGSGSAEIQKQVAEDVDRLRAERDDAIRERDITIEQRDFARATRGELKARAEKAEGIRAILEDRVKFWQEEKRLDNDAERSYLDRAIKAEAERDEWREVAARYADGRDKWQAKWRESDEAREKAEAALADERDRHDATITERDALRERLDALEALRRELSLGGLTWMVDAALHRDDERAKGEQR